MHIKEVDEHLDYSTFWAGREDTVSAGRAFWSLVHGLADTYPCVSCKPVAQTLVSGIHDMNNIFLKGFVYDAPRWREFTKMVRNAEMKAQPLLVHNPAKARCQGKHCMIERTHHG